MIASILAGVVGAVLFQFFAATFAEFVYECCVDSVGGLPFWYAYLAGPFGAVASLAPGFIAGWLAKSKGIVCGFLAGLFGYFVYAAAFHTVWSSVVKGGIWAAGEMILGLLVSASSWALIAAAAGGTAQLLRSSRAARAAAE